MRSTNLLHIPIEILQRNGCDGDALSVAKAMAVAEDSDFQIDDAMKSALLPSQL